MNDIIAHNNTIIRDNLIVDSSSSSASYSSSMDKLAHEDIIDGFSFLTFEFESELRKEFEKKRVEFSKTSADNCSSSSSSAKSRKKQKTATSGTKAKSVAKTTSSTASNSSFNDDQASVTAESTSAPTEEPPPPKSPSPPAPLPAADEQPSKKPKLDEAVAAPAPKSSYDMNTLLAAAASAAATAAVVAATGSSKTAPSAPNQLPPSVDYNSNPFLAGIGPNQSDPASSFINKIMEMCKQQIPNLNIPGILSKTEPNEPASAKQSPTTSKHSTPPSATFNHNQQQQPQQQQQQHSNIQKQVTNNYNNQQSVNTNPYSYMPYQKSAPIESTKYATMPMMSASASNDAFMYSHLSKPAPIQTAKPVKKAAGLTQYYPRTNGKWCAAHAKIANMIQEQKSKNSLATKQQQQHQQQQQQIHNHNNQQPMYSHQQMFDAYHTKKLHTPTFFPPVQQNLKQQQPLPGPPAPQHQTPKSNKSVSGARGHNLLATEAAITAAAANHHQMMMDKYRHDMMRMSGPNMMPGPPGMPFMPPPPPLPPGMHMSMPPFMAKSKKPVHPGVPLPPPLPPTSGHMAPFNPNPLVQHSFLQQFFMDKNFDPSRFALPPGLPPPPPPPGCLMPNMLKPDDKPIT